MVAPTPPRASKRPLQQLPGFHTPEREALMRSREGRQRYAEARRPQPLHSSLLRLVDSVVDGLRQYRMEALALDSWTRGIEEWNERVAKAALEPLVDVWRAQRAQILSILERSIGRDAEVALRDAERNIVTLVVEAESGTSNDAARARSEAAWNVGSAAHRVRGPQPDVAAELDSIAAKLRDTWPSDALLHPPNAPAYDEFVRCGERSRDLLAIARWMAPCLAGPIAALRRDPQCIREVETILSAHGGGPEHMCRAWPELRARIQALADFVAVAGGEAESDSGPDDEPEDGVVVLGWNADARCVTANRQSMVYKRKGERKMTFRHAVVRALGIGLRGGRQPHWNKKQAADFNEALRNAGVSEIRVVSSAESCRVEGDCRFTFTTDLLARLGVRSRK